MSLKGTSIFCDDIRYEVAGKFTLVGCYTAEMTIHGEPPVTLPKLGIYALLVLPSTKVPSEVVFRVVYDPGGEVLFESRIDADPAGDRPDKGTSRIAPLVHESGGGDDERVVQIGRQIVLSPLLVRREGLVRVRAVADGETVKLGSLRLRFAPPSRETQ